MRAFSHGCIRTQNVRDFAALLLAADRPVGPRARSTAAIDTGRNQSMPLAAPIPVYIAYFTAAATSDGDIVTYGDIYGRDAPVRQALNAGAPRTASSRPATRRARSAGVLPAETVSRELRHGPSSNPIGTPPRPASDFPALEGEIEADVAVDRRRHRRRDDRAACSRTAGLKVALVEARRVGEEVTGKSTAKITSQHNIAYTIIEKKFGEEGARLYADANETGVRTICELAARHGIACNLERKPAFTYTRDDDEVARIEAEAGLRDPPRPARLADPRHRPAVRGARRRCAGTTRRNSTRPAM